MYDLRGFGLVSGVHPRALIFDNLTRYHLDNGPRWGAAFLRGKYAQALNAKSRNLERKSKKT
jgi:hypothetical protein